MTDKLRAPIKELLDASLDEVRIQRMWRGMQQRPPRTAMPARWVLAGAAVALLLAVFGVLRTPDAGPLAARGGSTLTFDRPSTVLSDGSQIELAADARLELLENSGQSFAVRLERGRARFEVTPSGPRRWRMECGLATVVVIGTALTIERGASSLRVEVAHGIVEVRGEHVPGGLRRLTAGQSLSIADQIAANSGAERFAATNTKESSTSASPVASSPSQPPPTAAAHSGPNAAALAQASAKSTQHDEPGNPTVPASAQTSAASRSATQPDKPSAAAPAATSRAATNHAERSAPNATAHATAEATSSDAPQHTESSTATAAPRAATQHGEPNDAALARPPARSRTAPRQDKTRSESSTAATTSSAALHEESSAASAPAIAPRPATSRAATLHDEPSKAKASAATSGAATLHGEHSAAARAPAAATSRGATPHDEPGKAKPSARAPAAATSDAATLHGEHSALAGQTTTSQAATLHDEPSTAKASARASAAATPNAAVQHVESVNHAVPGTPSAAASAAVAHAPSGLQAPDQPDDVTSGPASAAHMRSPDQARASTQHSELAATATATSAGELSQGDAARSLAEADHARQRGDQTHALAILQRLLREQPGTSVAGIAAFTLARMQMEQNPRAAVEALRASLAAATPESLREDALARLVEAYARSGNAALASSTAAEYRRKYPSGRLVAEVERWAAEP